MADSIEAVAASSSPAREVSVTFSKGTVIEFAYAKIKPGKEPQLFGEYFPQVGPILQRYGGKGLGMFMIGDTITEKNGPDVQVTVASLFEWPDVDTFLRLHQDPEFLKIAPIRDEAMTFFNNGNFYTVQNDVTVTFREDRVYEIWDASLADNGSSQLLKPLYQQYMNAAETAAQSLGASELISMQPVPLQSPVRRKVEAACGKARDDTQLASLVLKEWSDPQALNQFENSKLTKEAKKLRDESLDRYQLMMAQFAFPPPPPAE
ncbi:MAG: hypothetical protein Tsb002_26810 [Wenzhouxiangellaceae bacterium]